MTGVQAPSCGAPDAAAQASQGPSQRASQHTESAQEPLPQSLSVAQPAPSGERSWKSTADAVGVVAPTYPPARSTLPSSRSVEEWNARARVAGDSRSRLDQARVASSKSAFVP